MVINASVKKLLLTGVAALSLLAATPSAEKMTMLCGDVEALVTVKRNPNKIDIYFTDPKMKIEDQRAEVRDDGYLYLNDRKCIATLHWICPADERTC
jgi:hypothetical protein